MVGSLKIWVPSAVLPREEVHVTSQERDKLFEELYRNFYGAVVSYFVRFPFPVARARELAQDVFVRVYQSMETYREEARWEFLKTISHRLALNENRKENDTLKRKPEESLDALPSLPPALAKSIWTNESPPLQEEELIAKEQQKRRRHRMAQALARLPALTRECLRCRLQGLNGREISEKLGITHEAVRSRLHDARKRLKSMLNENPDGIDWPDGPPENDQ